MPVTTVAAVKLILMRDYTDPQGVDSFIESAAAIVARVIECAARKGITLTDEEIELLERWLSAHLYTMSDKALTTKSTLSASGSFHGQTGMGFEASLYGQTAIRLDPSGCLAAIDKRKVGRAFWLGKPTQDQIRYDDRNTRPL